MHLCYFAELADLPPKPVVDDVWVKAFATVTVEGEERLEDPALDTTGFFLSVFLSARESVNADVARGDDGHASDTDIGMIVLVHFVDDGKTHLLHSDFFRQSF